MSDVDELLLNAYLDDEVTAEERAFVQAQLAQSAAWQAALAELMLVFDELEALEELKLTTDLSGQILAELPQLPQTSWLSWLLLAMQLVGGLVGIVALWPTMQQLARTAISPTISLPAVSVARLQASLLSWWQRATTWQPQPLAVSMPEWSVDALWEQWQTAVPAVGLTSSQWGLLLGVAFAVWLVGNGLLFRREDWSIG